MWPQSISISKKLLRNKPIEEFEKFEEIQEENIFSNKICITVHICDMDMSLQLPTLFVKSMYVIVWTAHRRVLQSSASRQPSALWTEVLFSTTDVRNLVASPDPPSGRVPYYLWNIKQLQLHTLVSLNQKWWYIIPGEATLSYTENVGQKYLLNTQIKVKDTDYRLLKHKSNQFRRRGAWWVRQLDKSATSLNNKPQEHVSKEWGTITLEWQLNWRKSPIVEYYEQVMQGHARARRFVEAGANNPDQQSSESTMPTHDNMELIVRRFSLKRSALGFKWPTNFAVCLMPFVLYKSEAPSCLQKAVRGTCSAFGMPCVQSEPAADGKIRTWKLVPKSDENIILTSKLVLKIKKSENTSFEIVEKPKLA